MRAHEPAGVFTCARCGVQEPRTTPPAVKLAEAVSRFGPGVALGTEQVEVCDDCYQGFLAWWDALPPRRKDESEGQALAQGDGQGRGGRDA